MENFPHEVLGRRTGIHRRVWSLFRLRDISGLVNKRCEFGVGYLMAVNSEVTVRYATYRTLVGVELFRPHRELATTNPDHGVG